MHRVGSGIARALAALGAIGCIAGCSSAEPDRVAAAASAIIDGTPDGPEHDSVVLIVIRASGSPRGACTGTLVAPNLVLTARHCVTQTDLGALCKVDGTPYDGGRLYSNFAASDLLIYRGQSAALAASDASRASAKGKQIVAETTRTYCDADIAFLVLDRPVTAPVAPVRLREGARDGETITAVGWGVTESGRTPSKRLARSGIRVEAIGPLVLDEDTQIGLGKSEFMIGEGICSGDSGGPAFAKSGAVVGVVSRGGNGEQSSNPADSCVGSRTIGIYTHLANKASLVQRAFAAAGATPRDEGTPPGKTAGESCEENVDCSSNTCVSSVCRTPCESDASCESGETCTTKRSVKVCLPSVAPEEPPAEGGDEPAAAAAPGKTTTTTTTMCAAAPATSGTSFGAAGALMLAAVLGTARRRRARSSRTTES